MITERESLTWGRTVSDAFATADGTSQEFTVEPDDSLARRRSPLLS